MSRVQAKVLPGVGVLHTFLTDDHEWIGVLQLPSGRRQLFVDDPRDADARRLVADLQPADSQLLASILSPTDLIESTPQTESIVDWVRVRSGSPADRCSLGDLRLRSSLGVTAVAVLREDARTQIGPDLVLHAGDIVVLTGGQHALDRARALLHGSG